MSAVHDVGDDRRRPRSRWQRAAALIALVASPLVLHRALPLPGVPVALVSAALALIVLAHLGLLAALLTPMGGFLRRRPRR